MATFMLQDRKSGKNKSTDVHPLKKKKEPKHLDFENPCFYPALTYINF